MKVILIKTPYIDIYGPIKRAGGSFFFLGLGYIAAVLRDHGHQVILLDPEAQGLNHKFLEYKFRIEKPDIVGISSATPDFFNAEKIANIAKKNSDPLVILGGIHASSLPKYILENHRDFDITCIGEGEYTLLEICKYLEGDIASLEEIKGIAFYKNGEVKITEPREPISDINGLPYPARDMVDLSLYKPHSYNIRKGKSATMITSRGCPWKCTFCASKITLGSTYRAHSVEYILSEIEHLISVYRITNIIILDDTFTFSKKRTIDICNSLIENKLPIEWYCFSQVNTVNRDILKLMKKAGCYCIGFGIESADKQILKNIKKPITPEQGLKIIKIANELGIKTNACYIFGNKGDNKDTINKTIRYACKSKSTMAFFNILTPYPGTQIFDDYFKDEDLKNINWKNFVAIGVFPVIGNDNLSKKELRKYIYKANLRFYFRPAQLFRILIKIRSMNEIFEYIRGGWGLILQMFAWRKNKRLNVKNTI